MNENTEYELLAKEIYQELINKQGITVDVKHNVKLEGRDNQKHQVDVYWEYDVAGVKHKVAIECKNYGHLVSVGKVRDFYGVLVDIGNINGIMVSKLGFQTGAITFAKKYGINLKVLREPTDEDWKGRIRKIAFDITLQEPIIKDLQIIVDKAWVLNHCNISKDEEFKTSFTKHSDDIWVCDSEGNRITNITELQDQLPHGVESNIDLSHDYNSVNGYIETERFGLVKLKFIRFKYDIKLSNRNIVMDAATTTKAILKDAIDGGIKFFNKKGEE